MNRFTSKSDRNFCPCEVAHAVGARRSSSPMLTADFIMVGQGPQLDPVGAGAFGKLLWSERSIRDDRMAVQVGIEDAGDERGGGERGDGQHHLILGWGWITLPALWAGCPTGAMVADVRRWVQRKPK